MTPEAFHAFGLTHPDSLADFRTWEAQLRKWNQRINLVAPDGLADFWQRHALDSAQILPHIPDDTRSIVDFGSGAGFPALAIAIDAKHHGIGRHVTLIESAGKKASFLKSVSRETSLNTRVLSERIERLDPLGADVITARAFAPLQRLLPMAAHHLKPGGHLLLLKGASLDDELEQVQDNWSFRLTRQSSLSDPTGQIALFDRIEPSVSRETLG